MDGDLTQGSRRELLLGLLQKEYPSYHPLVSIARIAHNSEADLKLQFECHKTIAKYVEPELKSIEVKGDITNRHRVSVSLFEPVEGEYAEVQAPEAQGNVHSFPHNTSPVSVLDSHGGVTFPGIDDDTVNRKVSGLW